MPNSGSCRHTKLKMNCKFQNKPGLYLGYFDFFTKSFSKLEFKKSPIQVHIIPNFKSIKSFKKDLGCIWVILIFSPNRFPNWNLRNPSSGSCHIKPKMNCKFQNKSGLYLRYFDVFSKLISQLDFKKPLIQVQVISNLK